MRRQDFTADAPVGKQDLLGDVTRQGMRAKAR